MPETKIDAAFERFRTEGRPDALAYVFDQAAAELLRLASHLSRDPHCAEDLVQATFLVAIEKSGDYEPRVGVLPWLVGILTNRARERRRQDGRRLDAARLASPEVVDPSLVAEAAELSDAMIAAVADLPAVYQPVLNLYLCHGFSAVEIAETLVRPPGTVRTQLVRGMDLLRAALPVGLAGAVAGLVVPTRVLAAMRVRVLAAVPEVAPLSTVGLAIGVVLMSKKVLVGLAAVVVALVSWFAWSGMGTASDAVPVESLSSASHAEGPAVEEPTAEHKVVVVERAEVPVESDLETATAATAGTVRGRCVGAGDHRPLAGCAVTVHWTGEEGQSIAAPSSLASKSDGFFSFPVVGGAVTVSVRLKVEGRATTQVSRVKLSAGGLDLGDLAMPTSCRVLGVVLDGSGNPVQGLKVGAANAENVMPYQGQISHPMISSVLTDRAGRFELLLYAASRWQLRVGGERELERGMLLSLDHGQSVARVELGVGPIRPQDSVAGVVVDEQGRPVVNAGIGPLFLLMTDEEGRFTLPRKRYFDINPIAPAIVAEKTGYESGRVPYEWGDTDLRITLKRGVMVDLLVSDAKGGEPVTDYSLRLMRDPMIVSSMRSWSGKAWTRARYDGKHEGGRTRIGPLTRGWTFVQIEPADPSFEPYIRRFSSADAAHAGLEVPLHRVVSRRVLVVDDEGNALSGCEVRLARALRDYSLTQGTPFVALGQVLGLVQGGLDPSNDYHRPLIEQKTEAVILSKGVSDASGEIDIQTVPVGRLALRVSHPDYLSVTVDAIDIEAEDPLVVTLARAASLVAKVLPVDFKKHIQPGASFGFYLESIGSKRGYHPTFAHLLFPMPVALDPAGVLRIDKIPPGTWKIVLQQRIPFTMFSAQVTSDVGEVTGLESGEKRSLTLNLAPWLPGELRGIVVLDGKPVAGEVVTLGQSVQVLTDARGRFRMRLPPGEYGMQVKTKHGQYFADSLVVLAAQQTIERRFEFSSRKIELRVVDADGKPVPDLPLLVSCTGFSQHEGLVTDAEGRAVLMGGPTGDVAVSRVGAYLLGKDSNAYRIEPKRVSLDVRAVERGIDLRFVR